MRDRERKKRVRERIERIECEVYYPALWIVEATKHMPAAVQKKSNAKLFIGFLSLPPFLLYCERSVPATQTASNR